MATAKARPVRQTRRAPGLLTRRAFRAGASQKQNGVLLRAGGQLSGEEGHRREQAQSCREGPGDVAGLPKALSPASVHFTPTGNRGPEGQRWATGSRGTRPRG